MQRRFILQLFEYAVKMRLIGKTRSLRNFGNRKVCHTQKLEALFNANLVQIVQKAHAQLIVKQFAAIGGV